MYFLIFQPEDMLNLCLNFDQFQGRYVYKPCTCKQKRVYLIRNEFYKDFLGT